MKHRRQNNRLEALQSTKWLWVMIILAGIIVFLPIVQAQEKSCVLNTGNFCTLSIIDKGDVKVVSDLKSNSNYCLYDCSASGTTELKEKGKLFDKLQFYDLNKVDYSEINYTIYYKPDKEEKYLKYAFEELEPGIYDWRIEGRKGLLDRVDWIPTIKGIDVSEWALWDSALVGYWDFNGGKDNYTANDSVYGNPATLTFATRKLGKIGWAINTSGYSGSYGTINYSNLYNFSNTGYSFSFWFNYSGINTVDFNGIMGKWGTSASLQEYLWGISSASSYKIRFSYKNSTGTSTMDSTSVINKGFWIHAVTVVNSTTIELWINGTREINRVNSGTMLNTIQNITLGGGYDEYYSNISIDELGIWNRSLTPGEISDLYNSSGGTSYSPTYTEPIYTEISSTYNSTTFETGTPEGFVFNITYNSSRWNYITANISYDNLNYTSTVWNGSNNASFTNSIIPLTSGTKSFFWTIGFTNSTNTYYYTSTSYSQVANQILFRICNSSMNVSYINFTFKDETTGNYMNSTASLTFAYKLYSGSKSYSYSNTSLNNPSYGFCFIPNYKDLLYDLNFTYGFTNYPSRAYTSSGTYTNTTTNQVLYLLSSSNGAYSTFQVINTAGTPISGAFVQVEKYIGGVWVLLDNQYTDSSGSTTFWLDYTTDHRITATKLAYGSTTVTIKPSQSLYTILLSTSSGNASYTGSLEGIKWKYYPDSGLLVANTTYIFGYNVTASSGNLVGCKMDIVNMSNYLLATTTGCSAYGGNISISFNVDSYKRFMTRLSLDTGSGYFVVDPISYWIEATNVSSWYTIKSFFADLNGMDDELGGQGARATFSKVVIFFVLLTLVLGYMNVKFGADFYNPGTALVFVCVIIWIASIGGWFQTDVFNVNSTEQISLGREFWNLYYIPTLITLFTAGFVINQWRKNG